MAAPTTARSRALAPARAPRPAPRPAKPPLRLVDSARRNAAHRRRRARLVVVVASVLAAGTLFLLAGFNAMLVTGQSRIDHLQTRVQAAQAQYSANRLRVAELEAPAHIVQVAHDKLGMVPPPHVKYLTPSEGVAAGRTQAGGTTSTAHDTAASGTSWATTKPYLGAAR